MQAHRLAIKEVQKHYYEIVKDISQIAVFFCQWTIMKIVGCKMIAFQNNWTKKYRNTAEKNWSITKNCFPWKWKYILYKFRKIQLTIICYIRRMAWNLFLKPKKKHTFLAYFIQYSMNYNIEMSFICKHFSFCICFVGKRLFTIIPSQKGKRCFKIQQRKIPLSSGILYEIMQWRSWNSYTFVYYAESCGKKKEITGEVLRAFSQKNI